MPPTQDAQEILQVENRRYEAMIKGDLAALDAVLSAELTYAHSNGVLDTKAQYMATLASGQLQYISITPQEAQVRCYGACSVVTGIALLHIQLHGQDRRFRIRYTSVYIKQQDRWQMVALQSTGLPDA
jgi:ketosteroid isomerase-like protein